MSRQFYEERSGANDEFVQITDAELIQRMQRKLEEERSDNEQLRREIRRLQGSKHHEVLCLVLKASLPREIQHDCEDVNAQALVNIARRYADLAYPPPKDEP